MSEPKPGEEAILEAALKLPPKERAAFLDQACAGDEQLRQRIVGSLSKTGDTVRDDPQQPTAPPPAETIAIPLVPEPRGEKPGDRIGRYKLLEHIAEGGMGSVWVAERDDEVRLRVALKVIKLGMDTKQVIARFEAERQALALMDHPNIAKALDAGTTATGRPYFVMELVRGIPITEYCDKSNLSTTERLDLFMQACKAIQHAHQQGIIHRDIKPSNILVTLHDGVAVPKVIDFGIAKATHGQRLTEKTVYTAFEEFIGTPVYMSPEQAEMSGLGIDTRSDIYSLGVLLYELLTGQTPFDAKRLSQLGPDSIRHIIREEEPPRPSTRLSTLEAGQQTTVAKRRQSEPPGLIHLVRGDLDWIVMKCLEKDRTRRYETVNGLVRDIERHLNDEPVTARPPSRLYRLQKLVRRNKLAFAAAGAVFLALLLGLGGTTWMFLKESTAHKRALRAEAEAKQREEDAQAVLGFFQDKILAAARPEGQEGGLGPNVTVQRAVEAAASQIATAFSNRPVVEAAIRNSLGTTLDYMGHASKAIPELERALALRQTNLGAEHPDTLTTAAELASVYRGQGRLDGAMKLDQETLRLRRQTLGAQDPATIQSMIFLALDYRRAKRLAEALPLHEEALKIAKPALGPDHLATLMAMNSLASAYREAGRVAEAVPLQEETLRLRRQKLGPTHPATLLTMSDLAKSYRDSGQTNECVKLNEEVVNLRKAKMGVEHPETMGSMMYLALAYKAARRFDDYVAIREEIYGLRSAKLGPEHPDTRAAIYGLAEACWLSKRTDRALNLFKPMAENGNTTAQEIVGEIYRTGPGGEQDVQQGLSWWRRAIEKRRKEAEHSDLGLNNAAWSLATCPYDELRDGALAVQYAEKAAAATRRKEANILDTLAAAYAEAGDFPKAVAAQKEAIALLKDEERRSNYRLRLRLYESKKPCRTPLE